ncbi:hypothetical protein GCM10009096_10210 [Parasphingorhabdus litoris]|uniref:DUF2550 family protein n=1 Tax=Parasphingorhabdus litoris TaxID=394733 RepID=A0ABN1A9Y6_9SPHN|nr:hypothetical protein [Parasphingorhabdus litoris]
MGIPFDETTILFLFMAIFLGMWLLVVTLLARISGWTKLQDRFPDRPDQSLIVMRAQSGAMGGIASAKVNFSGCLRFDVCRTGLRISVWKIFGPFQRPFFVPWSQINVSDASVFKFKRHRLGFGTPESGFLIIANRTAEIIAGQSPIELS